MANYPGEMRSADRSGFLGMLADLLSRAQGGLNSLGTIPQAVPLVGGQGAGDLAFGGGPALLDNMSYGFSPVRGAGMAATLDPAVVDLLALMPGAGRAAGVARDMPGVIRQAALDAYGPATHMARPRYTLGGREVPKEVVQAEFGFLPPVDEVKKAQKEAAAFRRQVAYQRKVQENRLNWDPNAGSRHRHDLFGQPMSDDEVLRAILERGKTLPNP